MINFYLGIYPNIYIKSKIWSFFIPLPREIDSDVIFIRFMKIRIAKSNNRVCVVRSITLLFLYRELCVYVCASNAIYV